MTQEESMELFKKICDSWLEGVTRSLKSDSKLVIVKGEHHQYMTFSDGIKDIPKDRLIFYEVGDD